MKRIEAIIRPAKIPEVCAALEAEGHPGVTISAVEGRGNEKGWVNQVRGFVYRMNTTARARLETVVRDDDADRIVKAIRDAALTGEVGDGKIFIHQITEAIRIRTNESGMAAL